MRSILFLLLFISISCKAQNCNTLTTSTTDKFTGKTTISLFQPITKTLKNGTIIFMMDYYKSSSDNINILFTVKDRDFGCTDESDKIYLLFSDSTRKQVFNSAGYNCDGVLIVDIFNYPDNIILADLFSEKILTDIKIQSGGSSYETSISRFQAERFRNASKCIFNK